MNLLIEPLRAATSQIDRIINAFLVFFYRFVASDGFFMGLVNTIVSNEYLLISVSLVIIGFVIGILKRLISF